MQSFPCLVSVDSVVYDPLPPDAGRRDVTQDYMIADMLPPDAGRPDVTPDRMMVVDPLPPDAGRRESVVYDPLPPDAGRRDAAPDYMIADMLPPDAGRRDLAPDRIMTVDPLPPDAGRPDTSAQPEGPQMVSDPPVAPTDALSLSPRTTEVGSHWADTTPRRSARSRDLPLCLPPEIRIQGEWVSGNVRVCLTGAEQPLTVRWQCDGELTGADRKVVWTASSDEDQLNVAVRSRDGVAVAELRLDQVRGRRG